MQDTSSQAYGAVLRSALLSDISPSGSRGSSFTSPLTLQENKGLERHNSWAAGCVRWTPVNFTESNRGYDTAHSPPD